MRTPNRQVTLSAWRVVRHSRERVTILMCFYAVWMLCIAARLFYLQVIQHDFLLSRAVFQNQRIVEIPAKRGEIIGRNGWILARDIPAQSLFVNPGEIENVEEFARGLAPLVQKDAAGLTDSLNNARDRRRQFVWIARKLDKDLADDLVRRFKGLRALREAKRAYPYGPLCGHVVGFVGIDHIGLGGLEQVYDGLLKGRSGRRIEAVDAHYNSWDYSEVGRQQGDDVVITIDEILQTKVEMLLYAAVEETLAKTAAAIVLDPRTGEILSFASAPGFDPDEAPNTPPELRRVDAVQSVYEFGSLMALFKYCMAAEELFKQSGTPSGTPLTDSLNSRITRRASTLDPELVRSYLSNFGFGKKTGVELPGESAGLLPVTWKLQRSEPGYPYPVAATLIQVISAYGAIANGGVRVDPHFVRQIVKPDAGDSAEPVNAAARNTVISSTATGVTLDMMKRVYARESHAAAASDERQALAAYFSQANKLDPRTRTYSKEKSLTTVVGHAPSGNTQYAILVLIDEGANKAKTKGVVARLFNRIAKAAAGGEPLPKS